MAAKLLTDADESQIALLYQAGASARYLARMYHTDHNVIGRALERQNVQQRSAADRNRLYPLDASAFDVIDNEGAAYWLGFLYADATISKRTLKVALALKDSEHIDRLCAFLRTDAPVSITYRLNHPIALVAITDEHVTQRLMSLGVSRERPNLQACIKSVHPSVKHHFLRGLFDGDGSAKRRPCISFLGSLDLMLYVREALANAIGTNPNLKPNQHSHSRNIFYMDYMGRIQALRVSAYLYRDASIFLPRKRNVTESWVAPKPRQRDELGRYR